MIRFEPRERIGPFVTAAAPVGALVAALALCALPLAFAGAPLWRAFALMAAGAAGSVFALTETDARDAVDLHGPRGGFRIPGAALQHRRGGAALRRCSRLGRGRDRRVRRTFHRPRADGPRRCAALAGGLLMLGPTFLKVRLGVDEVVTTLLLNFVVLLFVQMMLEGPFKDPMGGGWPQSEPILDAGALPPLVERMRLRRLPHCGRPRSGTPHRDDPDGVRAQDAGGRRQRLCRPLCGNRRHRPDACGRLSVGALAGLAGASEVAGLKGYLTADLSRGFGYAGIVVAMVAGLRPLWVVPSALFIAGIFVGADTMSRTIGVSNYIADLIVALALLCVLVSGLFTRYRIRWVGMDGVVDILLSASFWAAAVRIATPLMFGVLGALLCERAGVLNLGIEGIFTAGAMAGWLTVYLGGGLWTGVAVAALTGRRLRPPARAAHRAARPLPARDQDRRDALRHERVLLHLSPRPAERLDAATDRALPAH